MHKIRIAFSSLVALVVAALLTLGLSVPASAATGFDLTVKVTSKSGVPLSGVGVYALSVNDGVEVANDSPPKAKAVAHKTGYYSFAGSNQLLGGEYTLAFYPTGSAEKSSFSQLLGATTQIGRAKTFTVDGNHQMISASLATNSVISGTVKGPNGKALSGAYVQSYSFSGDQWFADSIVKTTSSGKYTLDDADPASYKLEVYAPSNKYPPVFSGGAATLDMATAFTTSLGITTTENVTFPELSGELSGKTVVELDGETAPLVKAIPAAYPVTSTDSNGAPTVVDFDRAVYGARSTSKGSWSVTGLSPGSYVIQMLPYYYNEQNAYLSTDGEADRLSSAEIFHVTAGHNTVANPSSIGFSPEGASLTVTVRQWGTNDALPGAHLLLQRVSNPDDSYVGTSSGNGTVTFGVSGKHSVIQPGDFTLSTTGPGSSWIPDVSEVDVQSAGQTEDVILVPFTGAGGFSTPPAIAQTDTAVGTTYSVVAVGGLPAATLEYQWFRDGHPIYGATDPSYISRSSDFGTQLSVRVEELSFGFPLVTADASVSGKETNNNAAPTVQAPPSITPGSVDAHAGSVLTALPGTWSVEGAHFSYQWTRNGESIADTTDHYSVTMDDVEKHVSLDVIVTPTKVGYPDASPVSADAITPSLGDRPTPLSPFVIASTTKGLKKGFVKYTVAPGLWTGLNPVFAYSWSLGAQTVGSTNSYVASTGKTALSETLEVRVTDTATGYQNPGSLSQSVRKATGRPVPSPTAPSVATDAGEVVTSDTPLDVGTLLDATPGVWSNNADSPTYSYKWERTVGKATATAISGATDPTYAVATADIGTKLSVIVTNHSPALADASAAATAGTPVGSSELHEHPVNLTLPAVLATSQDVRGFTSNEWNALGATETYTWYGCTAAKCPKSPLATSAFTKQASFPSGEFQPAESLAGGWVYVVATGTKTGDATAKVTSTFIPVAKKGTFAVESGPHFEFNNSPKSLAVGARAFVSGIVVGGLSEVSTVNRIEVCSSDCESPGASWSPSHAGLASGNEYTPDATDYADGDGYARIMSVASRQGYASLAEYSDPVQIVIGELDLLDYRPSLHATHNSDSSTTYTGVVPDITSSHGGGVNLQWYSGSTAEPGDSYTTTSADTHLPVFAAVTYDLPGYHELVHKLLVQEGSTGAIARQPITLTGSKFGDTFQVAPAVPFDLPDTPDADWTITYQWCFGLECVETDDPTFTPSSDTVGEVYSVSVQANSEVYEPLSVGLTPNVKLPPGDPIHATSAPTLSVPDNLIPGSQVSTSVPSYDSSGVSTSIAWQVSSDGSAWTTVTGQTATKFRPTLEEAGLKLRAQVSASKAGYLDVISDSEPVLVNFGDVIREVAAPRIPTSAPADAPLAVDTGAWSHDVTLHVQWILNGTPIPGATKTSYTPLPANVGDEISAKVTATRTGQLDDWDITNTTTISPGPTPRATASPKVTHSGSTYTISTGSWSVGGLAYGFQWRLDGSDIDGATSDSYVRSGSDHGVLSVVITGSRFGYPDGTTTVTGPTLVAAG